MMAFYNDGKLLTHSRQEVYQNRTTHPAADSFGWFLRCRGQCYICYGLPHISILYISIIHLCCHNILPSLSLTLVIHYYLYGYLLNFDILKIIVKSLKVMNLMTVKSRTAIKVMIFYFNQCLSVMLDSFSCSFKASGYSVGIFKLFLQPHPLSTSFMPQ